eukprot:PhF_6_TR32939/c0_g1_i2/m.48422
MIRSITLLGCASFNSCTPIVTCLTTPPPTPSCCVCHEAHANRNSKNHRLNPSLLIQLDKGGGKPINILMNCGKTFRETALRMFPGLQVEEITDVVLTHDGLDTFGGLDDLREFSSGKTVRVFCSENTKRSVEANFPYLIAKPGAEKAKTFVGQIEIVVLPNNSIFNFYVGGLGQKLRLTSVPVGASSVAIVVMGQSSKILYMPRVEESSSGADHYYMLLKDAIPKDDGEGDGFSVVIVDVSNSLEVLGGIGGVLHQKYSRAVVVGLDHTYDYDRLSVQFSTDEGTKGLSMEPGYDGMPLLLQT